MPSRGTRQQVQSLIVTVAASLGVKCCRRWVQVQCVKVFQASACKFNNTRALAFLWGRSITLHIVEGYLKKLLRTTSPRCSTQTVET
jgi:hypothetical protein